MNTPRQQFSGSSSGAFEIQKKDNVNNRGPTQHLAASSVKPEIPQDNVSNGGNSNTFVRPPTEGNNKSGDILAEKPKTGVPSIETEKNYNGKEHKKSDIEKGKGCCSWYHKMARGKLNTNSPTQEFNGEQQPHLTGPSDQLPLTGSSNQQNAYSGGNERDQQHDPGRNQQDQENRLRQQESIEEHQPPSTGTRDQQLNPNAHDEQDHIHRQETHQQLSQRRKFWMPCCSDSNNSAVRPIPISAKRPIRKEYLEMFDIALKMLKFVGPVTTLAWFYFHSFFNMMEALQEEHMSFNTRLKISVTVAIVAVTVSLVIILTIMVVLMKTLLPCQLDRYREDPSPC